MTGLLLCGWVVEPLGREVRRRNAFGYPAPVLNVKQGSQSHLRDYKKEKKNPFDEIP